MKNDQATAHPMSLLAGEGTPSKPPRDPLLELVCALTDPIIVYPGGGWEQDLPEPLKKRLPMNRLLHVMLASKGKASWDECTDTEAILYMYPRTMEGPMSEQWTRIYLYLGYKVMGDKMPEDIREKKLSSYDMSRLTDLKRWIQARKVRARKDREKKQRGEKTAPQAPETIPSEPEVEQLCLGF